MQYKTLFFLALALALAPLLTAQSKTDTVLSGYDRHWELSEGMYRVMLDGKVGIVNQEGHIIVPCAFNQVWNLDENGFFRVLKNGKAGIYHKSGKIIIPAEYDQVWSFKEGRAKVLRQGRLGYFTAEGLPVIPCEYQQIWSFENGRARVLKDGKIGYITTDGNEIIPPAYQQIWSFENGRARVLKEGKVGYIDTNGLEVIAPVYSQIWTFNDGKAKALLDGKMVWIDNKGHILDLPIEQIATSENNNETSASGSGDTDRNESRVGALGQTIIISEDGTRTYVEIGSKTKHNYYSDRHRRFRGHFTGFDLGFSNYLSADGTTHLPDEASFMNLNHAKSNTYAFNFLQWSIGLQRRGNIGLVTGLGAEYSKYRLSGPYLLTVDDMGQTTYDYTDRSIQLNRLSTYYLNLPLLLEFQIPVNHHHPFYLAAGGMAGYRLGSYTKVKYNDEESPGKEKKKGDFNLSDWRYGVTVRVGYKAIHLFGTYYFTTLFEEGKGPELYPVSVGVSINIDGLNL